MAIKRRPSFDPKSFLAKVGEGRTIGKYRKDQIVFSQGDPADAVFYIQRGKAKVTVISEQGKEAVVAILGADEFFGEAWIRPAREKWLSSGRSRLFCPNGRLVQWLRPCRRSAALPRYRGRRGCRGR